MWSVSCIANNLVQHVIVRETGNGMIREVKEHCTRYMYTISSDTVAQYRQHGTVVIFYSERLWLRQLTTLQILNKSDRYMLVINRSSVSRTIRANQISF